MKTSTQKKLHKSVIVEDEISLEEYVKELEEEIVNMGEKHTEDIDKLLDMINERDEMIKNSFDLEFIRKYFIPRIIPSMVCRLFGVSDRKFVLMAEEYELFKYPELATRIPRVNIKGKRVKSATTVVFSLAGIFMLKKKTAEVIRKNLDNLPVAENEVDFESL